MGLKGSGEGYAGIQFGFEWGTVGYREARVAYGKETVIYYQFRTADGIQRSHIHIVPDGCIDLLFCCAPARPSAFVCGPVMKGRPFPFPPDTLYFGVRLTPWLSISLPGLPMRELLEVRVPLEFALPNFRDLASRLAEQPDFQSRVGCFQSLGARLLVPDSARGGLLEYCFGRMYQTKGGITIRDLAADAGFSERYLRQRFEDELGIPPKTFGRIVRFQQTLRDLVTEQASFPEIANRYGYYDQAHFIKEFKSFSQMTPLQVRKMKRDHQALRDESDRESGGGRWKRSKIEGDPGPGRASEILF